MNWEGGKYRATDRQEKTTSAGDQPALISMGPMLSSKRGPSIKFSLTVNIQHHFRVKSALSKRIEAPTL